MTATEYRFYSSSPRRSTASSTTSSTSSSSSKMSTRARSVSFEAQPVYSRQPYDDEHHVMKTFSRHAGRCRQCADPYQVHLKGDTLCEKGHARALDVAQYVYHRNGRAYSLVDREGHQHVQLEIPTGCEPVRQLLRAMERGLRLMRSTENLKKAAAAPVSCDRTYYVAPRRAATEKVKPVERSASTTAQHNKSSKKSSHKHHISDSAATVEKQPRRSHSHHKHHRRDEHAQAWPRGGAVYYAPRQAAYEPRAAAPAYANNASYYSFPAYEQPRSGLISVW